MFFMSKKILHSILGVISLKPAFGAITWLLSFALIGGLSAESLHRPVI